MMCAATVNWTLVADIKSPATYVMLRSTIRVHVFPIGGKWLPLQRLSNIARQRTTASPPRFGGHQVVRAVIYDELAEVFAAVLDSTEPNVGNADRVPPGFPPKRHRFVHPFVALLLDQRRSVRNRLFEQLHHVGFRLVNFPRRIFKVFSEIRPGFLS